MPSRLRRARRATPAFAAVGAAPAALPSPSRRRRPGPTSNLRTFLLTALLGLAWPAGAQAASITGTVTEAAGGTAVTQYTVALYDAGRAKLATTCTDGAGDYAFAGQADGTYYVEFSGDPTACARTGFAPMWWNNRRLAKNADPVIVAGANQTGINASLSVEATISGTVRDTQSQAGIANISVRAFDSDGVESGRACSAAGGTYKLLRLNPLPYVVQFVADGSCGAVGAYPSRYYRNGDANGAAAPAAASSVSSDYGQDTGGISVQLSLVPVPPVQHTLSVGVTGAGTVTSPVGGISCPGTCTATRATGDVVTLTPTAAAGSTFTGWTGACTGAGACSVTLDADKTVGATFEPVGGGGGGAGGGGAGGGGAGGGGAGGGGAGGAPTTPTTPTSPTTPGTATPATTTPTPKARCTLAAPSKVKAGRFTVALRCDRRAKLALSGTFKYRRGRKTTTVKLRSAAVTATTKTVSVKLPAKALRALKAKSRLTVALTLKATTSVGTTTVTRRAATLKAIAART
jgi:hypothetical protein